MKQQFGQALKMKSDAHSKAEEDESKRKSMRDETMKKKKEEVKARMSEAFKKGTTKASPRIKTELTEE
jgi:hypothetical protein